VGVVSEYIVANDQKGFGHYKEAIQLQLKIIICWSIIHFLLYFFYIARMKTQQEQGDSTEQL